MAERKKPGPKARRRAGPAKKDESGREKTAPAAESAAETATETAAEPSLDTGPAKAAAVSGETVDDSAPNADTGGEETPAPGPKTTEPEKRPSEAEPPQIAPQAAGARTGKSNVFIPALIGGALAAAIGFAAGRSQGIDAYLPAFLQNGTADALADLRAADENHRAALAALRADLEQRPVFDPAEQTAQSDEIARVRAEIEAASAQIATLESRFGPIDARLSEVEKRPLAENVSAAAREAYERELEALRAEIQKMVDTARAAESEARAREGNAATAAELARNRAAVARLRAALDEGTPYAPILSELSAAGVTAPPALSESADKGVPTRAVLIAEFPPAARAALAVARAEDAGSGGLGAFLQRQLGARSVAPRSGDDPDAILSRAEAAAIAGDLETALSEIASLPEPARAVMADWVGLATVRAAALASAEDLAQHLNSN